MPRMVLELTSWGVLCRYGPAKEVWRLVPLCLMWCIWWEWNVRHFKNVETSMVELRKRFVRYLDSVSSIAWMFLLMQTF